MCIFENLILKIERKGFKKEGFFMADQNKISFPLNKILLIAFLFCLVASYEVMGQEVTEKEISELNHDFEGVENPGHSGLEEKTDIKVKMLPVHSGEKRVEQSNKLEGENEVKKKDLSTLSFNLFLYVADKFKEEN